MGLVLATDAGGHKWSMRADGYKVIVQFFFYGNTAAGFVQVPTCMAAVGSTWPFMADCTP